MSGPDVPQSPDAEVMTSEEGARFMRISVSWLLASDVPRVHLGRRVLFLRSECLAYVRARLSHRVEQIP